MIFETHAHYDDGKFDKDRDALLASLPSKGIERVINVGASIESTKTTLALAEKYDYVYAAVGVHPSDIDGLNEETFQWLKAQTGNPKTVAVGEIGLDYYWEKDSAVRRLQQEWFMRQMELAGTCQLPVIIHSRDAAEDTMKIMRESNVGGISGVVHCYSYSKELAREFVPHGTKAWAAASWARSTSLPSPNCWALKNRRSWHSWWRSATRPTRLTLCR